MGEKKLLPIVESYNVDEEYLYNKTYLFIKGYAVGRKFQNTLKALPLARKIHNNQYRKGLVEVDGKIVHLPYILHCLKVCSTLIALDLPLDDEELDILYTCALLHDTLEDGDFPKGGLEYHEDYGFPKRVGKIIKLLSKHAGSDEYELNEYFNALKKDKIALMVKLADRSHNVEDLYNMKNIPKYIKETKDYFIGTSKQKSLCAYGKQNYPALSGGITVLKAKILSLTEATQAILEKQECLLKEKDEIIVQKDEEINKLKEQLEKLNK